MSAPFVRRSPKQTNGRFTHRLVQVLPPPFPVDLRLRVKMVSTDSLLRRGGAPSWGSAPGPGPWKTPPLGRKNSER